MLRVKDIRNKLIEQYKNQQFVVDKNGGKVVELIGYSFIADEPSIFGNVNDEWNARELQWYQSKSLYVDDIPEPIPAIWKQVSSRHGRINSNYGWAVFSEDNGNQYDSVLQELKSNPDSRRGQMIYTRPTMHKDWNKDGMSDFMCCSNTTHFIRNGKLVTTVQFRSNDFVFGYKGDYAWINFIHNKLSNDLCVEPGNIIWNASSGHIYERHFKFLES